MNNKKGNFLITVGLLLVAAAFVLTGYNVWDEQRADASAGRAVLHLEDVLPKESAQAKNMISVTDPEILASREVMDYLMSSGSGSEEVRVPAYILNPEMDMPVWNMEGQEYVGILEIPVLGLKLPIISEWSYSGLKTAPCRYYGSVYTQDMVIAGHNYRSHFAGLQNIEEDTEVIFTDMDGNVFLYEVTSREILGAADVEEMTSGEWDLTLFTCTSDGAYRVTVRCLLT